MTSLGNNTSEPMSPYQIGRLRQLVESLSETIAELKADITEARKENTDLKAEIATLREAIVEMRATEKSAVRTLLLAGSVGASIAGGVAWLYDNFLRTTHHGG